MAYNSLPQYIYHRVVEESKMNKLFTLIIILLLATIDLYSQRNDGLRKEKIDSGQISEIVQKPARVLPTKNPGVPERERQRDNGTIVYPKQPVDKKPSQNFIPIDNNCPDKPITVYPDRYIPRIPVQVSAMELFILED